MLIDWCAFNKYLDLEDTFKEIPGPPTIETLEMIKRKEEEEEAAAAAAAQNS